jgi:glycosyltransferase involved in cell wall biosynthesis
MMRIKAFAQHDYPVTIRAATGRRDGLIESGLNPLFSMEAANKSGLEFLCPYGFEATWNGGPAIDDIEINAPGFVVSQSGNGILTFFTGYLFKPERPGIFWVRGPINRPKHGIAPLDSTVETNGLAFGFTMQWQFTQPGQTIRFEVDEPFCTLHSLQYAATTFDPTIRSVADEPDIHTEYLEWLDYQSSQIAARQLGITPILPPSTPKKRRSLPRKGKLPAVSCVCLTYGRPELLEEAIESFLMQDYGGQKELVVLNDFDQQTLEFDHPEVKIYNVAQRFSSLGEKLNAAVGLCTHDLIFVWDDDDIYLPHRLSLSVKQLDVKRGFFKASHAFFWNDGEITEIAANVFHSGACFTRQLFDLVQGYPHVNSGVDQAIEGLMNRQRSGATEPDRIAPEQLYYIYRWSGVNSYHISGFLGSTSEEKSEYDLAEQYVLEAARQGTIRVGQVTLFPHWKTDYVDLTREFLGPDPALPVVAVTTTRPESSEIGEAYPALPPPLPLSMSKAEVASLFSNSGQTKITVVLPALNEAGYLKRTVEQFQQTLPTNSEIIVVDNGSVDGCADFLTGQPDPPPGKQPVITRLVRVATPLGVAGARNLGLAHAAGEVVVFADAHMDVPENWWPPLVATLNQPDVGIVAPAITVMGDPAGSKAYGQRIAESKLRTEWLPKQQDDPYRVPTLGGGFMVMKRQVLDRLGGFDEGMLEWGAEDLEICVRYWLLGYEIWVVPEVETPHKFRTARPYDVNWEYLTHNSLRVAFLHFSPERMARVVEALRDYPKFGLAMAIAAESDVWDRRAEFAARRAHSDDWYFEYFASSKCVA